LIADMCAERHRAPSATLIDMAMGSMSMSIAMAISIALLSMSLSVVEVVDGGCRGCEVVDRHRDETHDHAMRSIDIALLARSIRSPTSSRARILDAVRTCVMSGISRA